MLLFVCIKKIKLLFFQKTVCLLSFLPPAIFVQYDNLFFDVGNIYTRAFQLLFILCL